MEILLKIFNKDNFLYSESDNGLYRQLADGRTDVHLV